MCIPLDIELEIIKRLPVKSLIRFISVCKAWKSLIKCSEFVAGYKVLPTQPQHLLIKYEVGGWQEPEVRSVCFVDDDTFPQQKFDPTFPPLLQLLKGCIIMDSCQGLLCFYGIIGIKMIVLWNPSIRKSIAVALPNLVPRPSYCVIGFGVCPNTKDPKLVMITYIDDQRKIESISCIPCQVMVFILSSREWTCLRSNQLPPKSIVFTYPQTVIGQFIYWLAHDRIAVGGSRMLIMSFDLSTNEFREIDLPDSLRLRESYFSISRLRESLVLFECIRSTLNKQVWDVWMMEHGVPTAFTKLFTFKSPNASITWPLVFRNSGEPIIGMQDDGNDFTTPRPCALVVYEPCSEHIKDLGIHGNGHSISVHSYMESLLLLDHDDGHIVRCGAVKS